MKIAEFGDNFIGTQKLGYPTSRALMDFDYLVVDLNSFRNGWASHNVALYQQQKDKFSEYLRHKKNRLIIFMPEQFKLGINNDHGVIQVNACWPVPVEDFETERQDGHSIIIKNSAFSNLFNKYKDQISYKSYSTDQIGTPLIVTPYTSNTLCFITEDAIFIPLIKNSKAADNTFLSELISILDGLKDEGNSPTLPDWTARYVFLEEEKARFELDDLEKKRQLLETSIDIIQSKIQKFNQQKIAFAGTGKPLEKQIAVIFKELGFSILEAKEGRDDLVLQYGDQIAVVEIKGVSGSSAEKHSNQLEKWVSIYYDDHEIKPKGILIVNSFHDTPLSERTTQTFPHQMLSFAEKREHCLMTSLQLMALCNEAAVNPDKREVIIQTLFDTVGMYSGFETWNGFLKEI